MDLASLGLVVLGLASGVVAQVGYDWVTDRLWRKDPNPDLRTNRGQARFILISTAGMLTMGAAFLAGPWLFDLMPLYSRYPFYVWPFLIGMALYAAGLRLRYFHALRERRR